LDVLREGVGVFYLTLTEEQFRVWEMSVGLNPSFSKLIAMYAYI